MLRELSIENVILIDRLDLEFGPGLNVLTGETGAGKSIIVGAVELLLGKRASQDYLRTGCDRGVVTGLFFLDDDMCSRLQDFEIPDLDEGTLILSREIIRGGKNVCRLNGKIYPLMIFKNVGEKLVDIFGQHEELRLFKPEEQLEMLDRYGGSAVEMVKDTVLQSFQRLCALTRKISELLRKREETWEKADFFRFQLQEIDSVQLKGGQEESDLEDQIKLLSASAMLTQSGYNLYGLLFEGSDDIPSIYDLLSSTIKELQQMEAYDASLAEKRSILEEFQLTTRDLAAYFRDYAESMQHDPQRLAAKEERLSAIRNLKLKYGKSVDEILKLRDEIQRTLDELEFSSERLDELEKEKAVVEKEYQKAAFELSDLRVAAARKLSSEVLHHLNELNMEKAQLKVELKRYDKPGERGIDHIRFLFSANPGEPLKELENVASGGELSRLMLALKSVLAGFDRVPVLIFDEVDSGIGGAAARRVGQKVSNLSRNHQVLCVTHSPQVASYADAHFSIVKEMRDTRTVIRVERLDDQQRVAEIARMLGGKEFQTAVKHAQEMIAAARE